MIIRTVFSFLLLVTWLQGNTPKNIILLIGDGMGPAHVTALTTVKPNSNIERFRIGGFLKTHSDSSYVLDSAASATALATGYKTNNQYVSISPQGDTLKTVVEYAEELGKSTGLVVTCQMGHATPACFAAHVDNRNKYQEIAVDLTYSGVDVLMGGSREMFIPQSAPGSKRKDDLDLVAELRKHMPVLTTNEEFIASGNTESLAYLYDLKKPGRAQQRPTKLQDMAKKAIEILDKNPQGFFLMVEGSQIDWGGHDNDIEYIIKEIREFDEAIGVALDFAVKDQETLVIVTADHETGGLVLLDGSIQDHKITSVSFAHTHHSGVNVPIFSYGPEAEIFGGIHDITFLGQQIISFNKSKY